jgi:hypothetical protein
MALGRGFTKTLEVMEYEHPRLEVTVSETLCTPSVVNVYCGFGFMSGFAPSNIHSHPLTVPAETCVRSVNCTLPLTQGVVYEKAGTSGTVNVMITSSDSFGQYTASVEVMVNVTLPLLKSFCDGR